MPRLVQTPDPNVGGAGDAPAISAERVARSYGSLHVLEDISFTAHAGELVSLVGPNGAGKTTLIRCISDGLERSGGQCCDRRRGDRARLAGGLRATGPRPQVPDAECL